MENMQAPVHLTRLDVGRLLWRALHDPIEATRRTHAEFGPFVVGQMCFRF
jgi:hypothetical protein